MEVITVVDCLDYMLRFCKKTFFFKLNSLITFLLVADVGFSNEVGWSHRRQSIEVFLDRPDVKNVSLVLSFYRGQFCEKLETFFEYFQTELQNIFRQYLH
jgi:hypothetical protein